MYVKRNEEGTICTVSVDAEAEIQEFVSNDSLELTQFLHNNSVNAQADLERSDLQMARIMEDTVNLLIDKGVIQITELPAAAQQKLMSRRKIRSQVQSIDLLDDDEILLTP